MKAVILAAGMGTRLKSRTSKPLSMISKDKTILDFQVEKLTKKVGEDNILIVVGHKKEHIMDKFANLTFVFNKAYRITNTSKSLLLALRKINDDVICIDGDLFFDEEVLDLLMKTKNSSYLVDRKKCTGKETKYTVNKGGFIKQISKSLTNHKGEALGIRFIRKNDLNIFRKELEVVENNVYGDKAMGNLTLNNKIKLMPIYIGSFFCKGVNTQDDLKKVKQYVNGK